VHLTPAMRPTRSGGSSCGQTIRSHSWEPSWGPFSVDGCGRLLTPLVDLRIRRMGPVAKRQVRVLPGVPAKSPVTQGMDSITRSGPFLCRFDHRSGRPPARERSDVGCRPPPTGPIATTDIGPTAMAVEPEDPIVGLIAADDWLELIRFVRRNCVDAADFG